MVLCCLELNYSLHAQTASQNSNSGKELDWKTREQIRILHEEKLSRTPAQKKLDSQLLYLLRQRRQGNIGLGLEALKPSLHLETDGRVLVDLKAHVSPALLSFIKANGGLVVNNFPRYDAIRALVPAELTESLARRVDVRAIRPADRATTSTIPITFEGGDIAHRAAEARQFFSTDGAGIRVGVLSDSIDGLVDAQNSGALPAVTVLPGQAGTGAGEGTAILEIVHALAPGSALYFATGLNSVAGFAQNIRALQQAGCRIIIDDISYFNESPFQDGPIAQAVNDVSSAGGLYFSSAGNSGGVDRGTSGTWEGDFKDGGPATVGRGGRLQDFGGVTYNTVLPGIGFGRVDLSWADPLGQSTNDYDLYIVNSSGAVVRSSTNIQDGHSDPYESLNILNVQDRIVIVKFSGEDRFLHLSTGRAHLTISTSGTTFGHNASGATNAFCIAATRVDSPPVPFVGGAVNQVEYFSSDGPRHIFFNPDGSPITPGDFSATGGQILQKPDLTAADGVFTSLANFSPFLGTSAAAPHAAAVAALVWSYNPFMMPGAVRSALTSSALPIGNQGFDQNSGVGIVMAYPALAAAPQVLLQNVQLQDANNNGELDPNECANLIVTLQNSTAQTISGITAVLSSASPEVFADPTPCTFPDLLPNQSAVSTVPFHLSAGPAFVCGSNTLFRLKVTTSNLGNFEQPFQLDSQIAGFGDTNLFTATNVPVDIPDLGGIDSGITVSGIALPLARVRVAAYITHAYDQDLVISLVAPDSTEVLLSANNGQSGHNYGAGCDSMTYFSDEATSSISTASAPFVGVFTPEQSLSVFQGKSGAAVNGLWKLRVEDTAGQDVGTLQCWSLELTPIGCNDGGGQCLIPPALAQDVSDQIVTNGAGVQFGIAATGTDPLFYQWYFNSTNALPLATNATLQLTNVSLEQAGVYQAVVTNVYGSITSSPASLTIILPAMIVADLLDQVATNGDTVTWTLDALGSPPLSYQWYFDSTNLLADATNSTLVLSNVTPAQAGNYDVTISNAYGSVTSALANLSVVVLPSIVCGTNVTLGLGSSWDFTPPSYEDTNLTLQVLKTTTNSLCGESFSATRQWLVSDTNGYQVTCSQTIQVLDTNAPLISCPADKSVVSGSSWSFDVPTAQDPEAAQALVYDNWTNNLSQALDPGQTEVGNQITLADSQRYPSLLSLEYWGTNATQQSFAGTVTARVRFYSNDGPALLTGPATPGTIFYDSGPLGISATNQGALLIQDFELSAAVPLSGPLPSNFTWTVAFSGLGSNDAAGLSLYGPPVVGQAMGGYWALGTNGWTLEGQPSESFGAQLAALSSGVSLSVLSTVTNTLCARSFSATRTWQALDACSNASSCSQTVTVLDQSGPLVLSQPQDQAMLVGQTVTLSVEVSSCPPVFYQWYFNQTNALAQETNAILVLTNISTAQAGTYQVAITNDFGSITSDLANVVVEVPAVIVRNPQDQVATNGDDVHWRVLAKGTAPLFYQWYFNLTNVLDQETNAILDLTNVGPAQAGAYQVVVTNVYGSATSAPANLTIVMPPSVITNLADHVATNGDTVTWTVLAQGTDPLSYQWYFNSTLLSLETNDTLVLSNVVPAQAGIYQVTVANNYGSVTSAPANLTVVVVPRIVCSSNTTVALGSSWDFSPPTYSDTNLTLQVLDTTTNTLCGASFSATREWVVSDTNGYQAACSQTVQVLDPVTPVMSCPADKTTGLGADWKFDLPTARDPRATESVVYDNWTNNLNQSVDPGQMEVGNEITLAGAERYLSSLSFDYWGTNATQDSFAGPVTARVRFYNNNGPTPSSTIFSPGTVFFDSGPLPITATNRGAVVLQEFALSAAVPLTGALPSTFTWTVVFSGLSSNDAAGLNLYGPPVTGQAPGGYWALETNGWTLEGQPGASFGAQLTALSSGVSLSVVSTVTNALCAGGFSATRTWQGLDVCSNAAACSQTVSVVDPSGLVLISQPQNQAVLVSQTVSLGVGASSCSPVFYQWYFNQTNALAQETNATLVLDDFSPLEVGSYEVVVTNAYNSVTSTPASISIATGPTILSQPQDTLATAGETAVLSVSAEGSPAPVYQWFFNDTNLVVGATDPILTLPNVQDSQAGFYSVLVSNIAGSVTSTNARLTVTDIPIITSEPLSYTVFQGADVVFTVAATGTAPLSYQWMANCTRPISGANSTSLRLKSVGPLDSGSYCVAVSNAVGFTSSEPAVLRVLVKPKLTSITRTQNSALLSFATVTNLLYTVYSSDALPATNWVLLPTAFQLPGTGFPITVPDPAATGNERFYRIIVQ